MLLEAMVAVSPLPGANAGIVAFRMGGKLHVTVIAKATFAFVPDAAMSRADPQPILREEVHYGDNPARSVRFTSDLVPYLARADVLFTGHGYARSPGPTQNMTVRLRIQAGERVLLDKALLLQDSRGFHKMPLVYERAFGGPDIADNPLGIGASGNEGEPTILGPSDSKRPIGFGPIARAWPIRKRLLGTTPRTVLEGPIADIPLGFDGAYFQAAPPDQQIDFLRGDELIVLENLHPSLPRIATRLPNARGVARLHGLSAYGIPEGQLVPLGMDTLRIDGDEQKCTVVCRRWIQLPDESALDALRVVAGVEMAGEPLAWPEPPRHAVSAPASAKPADLRSATLALPPEVDDAPLARSALPFQSPPAAWQDEIVAPPMTRTPPEVPAHVIIPFAPPSALSASNAAAECASTPNPSPMLSIPKEPSFPERVLDLLWFDPRSLPRIRKQPAWRMILEKLADKPLDPDIDDPDLGLEPAEVEDRRDIFEILAHGVALGEEAMALALRSAVRKDGRFVAPLLLVEGALTISFDEIEALRALVAVISPLEGGDERTKEALKAAREYLGASDPLRDPVAARELGTAIEVAYAQAKKRTVSPAEVLLRVERILLENRRYQRRAVLGAKLLRGGLRLRGSDHEVAIYWPEAIADILPMFKTFSARMVVEAHFQADERESSRFSLKGVAIARIADMGGGEGI